MQLKSLVGLGAGLHCCLPFDITGVQLSQPGYNFTRESCRLSSPAAMQMDSSRGVLADQAVTAAPGKEHHATQQER